jgi:hypothetical protein
MSASAITVVLLAYSVWLKGVVVLGLAAVAWWLWRRPDA